MSWAPAIRDGRSKSRTAALEEARSQGRFEDDDDFPDDLARQDRDTQSVFASMIQAVKGLSSKSKKIAAAASGVLVLIVIIAASASSGDTASSTIGGTFETGSVGSASDGQYEGDCSFDTQCHLINRENLCPLSGSACHWRKGECKFTPECRCFDVPPGSEPSDCVLLPKGMCELYWGACEWDKQADQCLTRDMCPQTNPPTTVRPSPAPTMSPVIGTRAKDNCRYDESQKCTTLVGKNACRSFSACRWAGSSRCQFEEKCKCWDGPTAEQGGCVSLKTAETCEEFVACSWAELEDVGSTASIGECQVNPQCRGEGADIAASTDSPSKSPTSSPSKSPTSSPSKSPTSRSPVETVESGRPSPSPSSSPSHHNSPSWTPKPTGWPTSSPTELLGPDTFGAPSFAPSKAPSDAPSLSPTKSPETKRPGWGGRL